MEDIFKQSIDCITNEPYSVPFKIEKGYKGWKPKEDVLKFPQTTFGTMIRLQPLLSSITDLEELTKDDNIEADLLSDKLEFLGKQLEIIEANQDAVLNVICLAYWNKQGDYPQEMKEFFKYNIGTFDELFILLRGIISRLNVGSFTNSIMLLKKSMSLITSKEMIACSNRCKS